MLKNILKQYLSAASFRKLKSTYFRFFGGNRIRGQRVNPSKDVLINSHVWVGHGVSIGKGVTLSRDMVVGACSYVAKSIDEPHSIVAGVPAKVVRRNFTWNINRI